MSHICSLKLFCFLQKSSQPQPCFYKVSYGVLCQILNLILCISIWLIWKLDLKMHLLYTLHLSHWVTYTYTQTWWWLLQKTWNKKYNCFLTQVAEQIRIHILPPFFSCWTGNVVAKLYWFVIVMSWSEDQWGTQQQFDNAKRPYGTGLGTAAEGVQELDRWRHERGD